MRLRLAAGGALLATLLGATAVPAAPRARISPATVSLTLRPGQSRSLPFTLDLPARPARPLDVLFLVDTSAWGTPDAFTAARDGLVVAVRRFSGRRGGVRFAVAEFRGLGDADARGQATYRMLRRFGPADEDLVRTILALRPGLVDHPQGAATTIALDQALHGDGHLVVPEGEDARFGEGHDKVVVVVSDSPVAQLRPDVYPDVAETAEDLRTHDVDVVTLSPWTTRLPASEASNALRNLARWGAWRGVDCDGDGRVFGSPDVVRERELYCVPRLPATDPAAARERVGALVHRVVESIGYFVGGIVRVPAGMRTDHDREGHPLYPVRSDLGAWTDGARPYRARFPVTVRCPSDSRGRTYRIGVGASRSPHEKWYDLAAVTLRCR
jgi:hypothetical protein